MYSCVWFDQFYQDLSSDVAQQVLNVFPDKRILHDVFTVDLQDLFKLVNIIILVSTEKNKNSEEISCKNLFLN